ncbi:MAG TPA: RrF2 family transcriptional regulator [Dehalococcoidia bacterium]|nr:RrF2 family transcriptional regulator [Dehalococcoidia bacterium]
MKLSTRGQYATRALVDLAMHRDEAPILLKDIARRQQISQRYLEHLITPLVAAGIIVSTRGPKGGITLVKSPEEIRLDEVIQLLEGAIAPVECINNPGTCIRSRSCATRDVWDELRQTMTDFLRSVTIQDLMERQREKEKSTEVMYYI